MKEGEKRRLAELEAELATLKSLLASRLRSEQRDKTGGEGDSTPPSGGSLDGLVIDREDDLYLATCPPFVRQLLDELPVQVFLKRSVLVEGRGRQYTYLNRLARKILGWEAEEVPGRFDSEAFQDGCENPQWIKMVEAETRTIASGVRAVAELQWTSPLGDEWRINKVTQLPVFYRTDGGESLEPIGFCSIAQDIEFKQFQKTNQFFTRAVLHEYGNLCSGILSDIDHARAHPDYRDRYLTQARSRAIGAKGIATALFEAVRHLDSTEVAPVTEILDRLRELTRYLPIELAVDVPDDVLDVTLSQPRVAVAVLLHLIANGEKHTSDDVRVNGRAKVWITVRSLEGGLEWIVTNLRKRLDGQLDLSDRSSSASLGGAILGNLVRRAFRVESAQEIIQFPSRVDRDMRVNVKFLPPRGLA